ncbi:MAG: hypothetical protein F6K03_02955 [Kamptonema sp. SIO4C4]|nr:hypothetical protein [Kamptonema sp. SIO4C4]
MELQLATNSGVSVPATSTNRSSTRLSQGDTSRSRSLFSQIESDLLNSEVYQSLLVNLQEVAEDTQQAVSELMQAFGREAIRLTFQQIAQNYHVTPSTLKKKVVPIRGKNGETPMAVEKTPVQKPSKFVNAPPSHHQPAAEQQTQATKTSSSPQEQKTPPAESSESRRFPFPRRITKAQRIKMLIEERNTICRQIGQTLKDARQAQSVSLGELHSKTLVQICFIKALEEGQLDKLPEDIYLRGFIRRLGQALGLDGNALAQSLPKPPKEQEDVIPSWYTSQVDSAKFFSMDTPASLNTYLGYTAVVAGAIGGLAWVSGQQPGFETAQIETDEMPTTEYQASSEKHSSQSVTEEMSNAEIAPPEMTN